jgi:hypothetical protein
MSVQATGSVPHSTPHKLKLNGIEHFSSTRTKNDIQRQKAQLEMQGYFVGPMAPQTFLDQFMAPAPKSCPTVDFSKVSGHSTEALMYQPFVSGTPPILALFTQSDI